MAEKRVLRFFVELLLEAVRIAEANRPLGIWLARDLLRLILSLIANER